MTRTVARLDITPRGSGPAWLIDAWGWRPGTPAPRPAALDRVDVGAMTVDEGDSGTKTYSVPVKAYGHLPAKVRLFLPDLRTGVQKTWVTTVKPGASRVTVPISVVGNTTYGGENCAIAFKSSLSWCGSVISHRMPHRPDSLHARRRASIGAVAVDIVRAPMSKMPVSPARTAAIASSGRQ